MTKRTRWGAMTTMLLLVAAEPYVPVDRDEVLETLPRELLARRDELADLRRALLDRPDDLALATDVAARCVALGKSTGDPRHFGYARAALRPWWERPDPPVEVLRLRAKLLEADHLYAAALADQRRVLDHQPGDVQAWVEVANLHRVRGEYEEAYDAASRLAEVAGPVHAEFARAPLDVVTGRAAGAAARLEQLRKIAEANAPDAVPWVRTLQADIAVALGNYDEAETHFRAGLALAPQDFYLLRGYGDFLLERGRADAVLPLLEDHTADTGVLLTAAIAARQTGDSRAQEWRSQLRMRFDEIRLRGGEPHGRFESRFVLVVEKDPARALAIALENWEQQKELNDARNVLEAALATNQPAAAAPVIAFLQKHGTEHVELQRLVRELESP